MKLAVMQPYFFPYLGYFQLLQAVDLFVIYDDVAFIKKGWINRNFILMQCHPLRITVPLCNSSQFRSIANTQLAPDPGWSRSLLNTLRHAYVKAPHFESVFALVAHVIEAGGSSLADLARASIVAVASHLGISTAIRPTSRVYGNSALKGTTRILDICRREQADSYYNLPGGKDLYDRATFATAGVQLHFIRPEQQRYPQFACPFVPGLSIIDALMFNPPEAVQQRLTQFELT